METKEQRLKRLQNGSPREALLTLINLQGTWFVDAELKPAAEKGLFNLLILGIHAVAETWVEILYPEEDAVNGFSRYLQDFVDGDKPDKRFSEIAIEINCWRNIIAHQWLSSFGHNFGINPTMSEGWKRDGGVIYFNPIVYFECFLQKFDISLTLIEQKYTEKEREVLKKRIIARYEKR